MACGAEVKIEFDPKDMPFRRLGPSGLRVPVFALGGWLTKAELVKNHPMKESIKIAFDAGINMFDNAETHAQGGSELEMGRAIRELGMRRSDIIVTTKIFWGCRNGPNALGLSRKHIIEGTQESLGRMGLDYVDIIFAHRYDVTTPMEEVVRAFNWVIKKGWAFYWATSEWTAREIEEAWHIADKLGLSGPIAEQCEHHMFRRERPEKEYDPLCTKYKMCTMVFSPLANGVLTGKYNDGIPAGSRFDTHSRIFSNYIKELKSPEGQDNIRKLKELTKFAEQELDTTPAALALAWVARNTNTGCVILGARSAEQLRENLKAVKVIPKLTPEIMQKIEDILQNKPSPPDVYGRAAVDPLGRKSFYI